MSWKKQDVARKIMGEGQKDCVEINNKSYVKNGYSLVCMYK